jgi:signal peptidase I
MLKAIRFNDKYLIRNAICVAIGLAFFLGMLCSLRPIICLGDSMLPTFHNLQLLTGTSIQTNPFVELERGDIVLVRCKKPGKLFSSTLIKRLIAMPGDTLEFRDNHVYLNGVLLQEPYLKEPMIMKDAGPFTMGDDCYFVMGDNRNISADSRCYGLFSKADITTKVNTNPQPLDYVLIAVMLVNFYLWIVFLPKWDSDDKEDT